MVADARAELVALARSAERASIRVSPPVVVSALVALSFCVRVVAAWARATPNRYPDEYLYAELGRSIAASGLPLVRGRLADFPALLMPLLTAPAWLFHDVATAFRIVQAIGSLSMSLAAVPAYLIARRLRLGTAASIAVAALTLAVPDLLSSSYVVAGPFAYPLFLTATLAAITTLERPSRRAQMAFVALAALATLARTQFLVLPAAFVVAALIVGLLERRPRQALAEQRLALGLFALGACAFAAAGLGYYSGALHLGISQALPHVLSVNVLMLCFASGWVIVPGALVALAVGLARPLDRSEAAFCAFATATTIGLFTEAGLYGPQAHERYVVYSAPLLALAFWLYVRRGFPHKLAHAAVTVALLTLAVRLPLTRIAADGVSNSPVLLALLWLRGHVGSAAAAASLPLHAVLLASAVLLALSWRPRVAARFAAGFAVSLALATWVAATRFDHVNSDGIRRALLPAERSWVDARGLHDVALLQAYGGSRTDAFDQLFWNRSVDRVLLLPGANRLDAFSEPVATVTADGRLVAAGRPVVTPLLVDRTASSIALLGGRVVASSFGYDLWVPEGGPARLASYFAGRSSRGWLAPVSLLELWPAGRTLAGTVRVVLEVPRGAPTAIVQTTAVLRIAPGHPRTVVLGVCSGRKPWSAGFRVLRGWVLASKPVYRAGAQACGVRASRAQL